MEAKIFIKHYIYDDNKSFQRFVPEEEKKDYGINIKLRVDSLNELSQEVSDDIEKLIWNYSGSDIQTNALDEYLKADKKVVENLKKEDFDYSNEIKLVYDDKEILEEEVLSPLSVKIYNPKGENISLGNLIEYYNSGCDFPLIIEIDLDNCSEMGEEQFNIWVKLTRKLLSIPNGVMPMVEKIKRLPKKTFKFETINQHGTLTKGYFEDVKLIEKLAFNKYAIYVKSIIFVANNE